MSTFFEEINNSITTVVIDGVLNYLESQNVDVSSVTADDIATHLGTQYVPRGGKAPTSGFQNVPAAKKTASTQSTSDGGCGYIFTRGTNAGNPCGKAANGESYEGQPRCKAHAGKLGKDENAAPKGRTASKPTVKPGAPRVPTARPPPPSSAPRREVPSRGMLRPVPGGSGLMYDPKSLVVVNNQDRKVVGIYLEGEVKHYLSPEHRENFSMTNYTIPDDLPETEEEIFYDDTAETTEAAEEAGEETTDAVEEAGETGGEEASEDVTTEVETEPVAPKRPPPPKRPSVVPGGVKRPGTARG